MYLTAQQLADGTNLTPTAVEVTSAVFRSLVDPDELAVVLDTLDVGVADVDDLQYFTTMYEDRPIGYVQAGNMCYLLTANPQTATFTDSAMFYWCGLYLCEVMNYIAKGVTYTRVTWDDEGRGEYKTTATSFSEAITKAMIIHMYGDFETSCKKKEKSSV